MSGDEQRGDHFYFREFAGKHTLMFSAPSPISVAGDTNIHLSLRFHDGEGHKFSTALFRKRLGVAALTTPSFRIQIKIAVISLGSLCTIRQSAHVSPSSLYIRRREAITVFILQTPGQRPPFRHVFSTPEQLNFFFLHQGLKYWWTRTPYLSVTGARFLFDSSRCGTASHWAPYSTHIAKYPHG